MRGSSGWKVRERRPREWPRKEKCVKKGLRARRRRCAVTVPLHKGASTTTMRKMPPNPLRIVPLASLCSSGLSLKSLYIISEGFAAPDCEARSPAEPSEALPPRPARFSAPGKMPGDGGRARKAPSRAARECTSRRGECAGTAVSRYMRAQWEFIINIIVIAELDARRRRQFKSGCKGAPADRRLEGRECARERIQVDLHDYHDCEMYNRR